VERRTTSMALTPDKRSLAARAPALSRRAFVASLLGMSGGPVAVAAPKLVIGRQQTRIQPSGSLTPAETWSLAQRMLSLHERGETRLSRHPVFLFRVAGTGSMRPAIGDGDVVIMESAPFSALGLGDVVWWIDDSQTVWNVDGQRGPLSVLHRITGTTSRGWITRGDNNAAADSVVVTAAHYRARVCQVIHSRKTRV
jgi:hypothetical protein